MDKLNHFDSEEHAMATIVIQDLAESVDLDHQAMTAIIGGARARGRPAFPGRAIFRTTRLINYPTHSIGKPLTDASLLSAVKMPRK